MTPGGGLLGGRPVGARRRPAARPASASSARIGALGLVVVALAEVPVADLAARVDQVLRRPVLVAPGVPGAVVVVERDRVAQAVLARSRRATLDSAPLERRTPACGRRRPSGPRRGSGRPRHCRCEKRPQAVDAGVGPEVDQHDAPAQAAQRRRPAAGRVEPARDAGELGRRARRPGAAAAVARHGRAWPGAAAGRAPSPAPARPPRSSSPPAGLTTTAGRSSAIAAWKSRSSPGGEQHGDARSSARRRPAAGARRAARSARGSERPSVITASSATAGADAVGEAEHAARSAETARIERDHGREDRPRAGRVDAAPARRRAAGRSGSRPRRAARGRRAAPARLSRASTARAEPGHEQREAERRAAPRSRRRAPGRRGGRADRARASAAPPPARTCRPARRRRRAAAGGRRSSRPASATRQHRQHARRERRGGAGEHGEGGRDHDVHCAATVTARARDRAAAARSASASL